MQAFETKHVRSVEHLKKGHSEEKISQVNYIAQLEHLDKDYKLWKKTCWSFKSVMYLEVKNPN